MEQEIVKVADAVPDPDPVTETLERLEVADTIEDLRHHIDELIARLSEQENAGAAAAERARVSPDLEGQLENLGGKVESASCLLAELADLLEAQTERIETIEQQLGGSHSPRRTRLTRDRDRATPTVFHWPVLAAMIGYR